MTSTSQRPRPALDLSLTHVLAGALGAVVATAVAARLQLAGTLVGAALVTVVATVASALVSLWIRRGRHRLARSRPAPPSDQPAVPVATAQPPQRPTSARPRAVLAGLVGGITAATLLAATGHPPVDVRIDAGAVVAIQRGADNVAEQVRLWLTHR